MLTAEAGHRGYQRLESGGRGTAAASCTATASWWSRSCRCAAIMGGAVSLQADRGGMCVCVESACVYVNRHVWGLMFWSFLFPVDVRQGCVSLLTPPRLSPLPAVHWHCGIRGPVRNTHLHTPHLCEAERAACSPPCVVLLSSSGMRGEGSAVCVAIA